MQGILEDNRFGDGLSILNQNFVATFLSSSAKDCTNSAFLSRTNRTPGFLS
jgi:hypothetical protein